MYRCSEAREVKIDLLNTKAEVEELKAEIEELKKQMALVIKVIESSSEITGALIQSSAKHQDALQTLAKHGTGVWSSTTHVPGDKEIEPR